MTDQKIIKSDEEWRKTLTGEQYRIMRQKGTEAPGTGEYYHHNEEGMYLCGACDNELFQSGAKFESGSGWPSFSAPASNEKIEKSSDITAGMTRTEVKCNRCGGHLGHVFDDGPTSTGQRYCINSCALKFRKG